MSEGGLRRSPLAQTHHRLHAAATGPLFRQQARELLGAVASLKAEPADGSASLGLAVAHLLAGDTTQSRCWAEIATDRLAVERRLPDALGAQLLLARARVREREVDTAREILRDVTAALARLFDLDAEPEGAARAPFLSLRGHFALAAAEIRLESQELGEARGLYRDAAADLVAPTDAHWRLMALHGLAMVEIFSAEPLAAVEALRGAASIASAHHASEEELEVDLALCNQLVYVQQLDQARRLAVRCLERARDTRQGTMEAAFSGVLALIDTYGKRGSDAVEGALDAMEAFARVGDPWGYTQMISLVANGQLRQGLIRDAAKALLAGAAALRAQGLPLHAELLRIQLEELVSDLDPTDLATLPDELSSELRAGRAGATAP